MNSPSVSEPRPPLLVRFGAFELDLARGELRRQGRPVGLQELPLRLLVQLVERPGETVRRDEIRRRLWPESVVVDFEHGLNTPVRKLRRALGDSPARPRFVETIPRRGYRFVARSDSAVLDNVALVPPIRPTHEATPVVGREGVLDTMLEAYALAEGGVRSVSRALRRR